MPAFHITVRTEHDATYLVNAQRLIDAAGCDVTAIGERIDERYTTAHRVVSVVEVEG